ncbi:MAG: hypothetical protein KC503_13215, partial [Myxococcales bacterium]|nr:hypothetical protein [Myxococcales bacterium]
MRHTLSTLILVVSLSSLCAACSDSSATPTDAARDRDVSDARVVDAPATDTPGADAPAVDAPAVDGPAADGPAADGPAADGPAADAPPADAPAPDTTADSSTDASVDTLAPPSWLDDTSMPLPTSIKQLGIFPDPT